MPTTLGLRLGRGAAASAPRCGLLPMLAVLFVADVMGACEVWCSEPCADLNGDVKVECGDCFEGQGKRCHPGAPGFDDEHVRPKQQMPRGAQRASEPIPTQNERADMGGMGMGMGNPQRVRVQPTGATSLFSQPEAPRADAKLFAKPASFDDEQEARSLGGSDHYQCRSAACARVRLSRMRDDNERVAPMMRDRQVLAGGDEVPCEFQRTSRAELAAMSRAEREEYLTRAPTVISGLTDEWPARHAWSDPRDFSERFGHHTLRAIRAGWGFSQLARIGGNGCHNFDEARCPGQMNATISLAELVPYSDSEQIVIMDLEHMSQGEHDLLTDLTRQYELPEFLEALSNIRLLSLGGRPEGVQMSAHSSAWLSVVQGAKLWHLAPPERPQPSKRFCPGRGKIDYALARREGVLHCMAYPGEVVVVPDLWWHATCNMLPYTVAIGGQTWDSSVRRRFEARDAAAQQATRERWRRREPRPLNHFQEQVLAHGLDVGERIATAG